MKLLLNKDSDSFSTYYNLLFNEMNFKITMDAHSQFIDQSYIDFDYKEKTMTLHREHYLGVFLISEFHTEEEIRELESIINNKIGSKSTNEFQPISNYITVSINWTKCIGEPYYKAVVDGQNLILMLNDFPEKAIYTMRAGSLEKEIDEIPNCWKLIQNREELKLKLVKKEVIKDFSIKKGELVVLELPISYDGAVLDAFGIDIVTINYRIEVSVKNKLYGKRKGIFSSERYSLVESIIETFDKTKTNSKLVCIGLIGLSEDSMNYLIDEIKKRVNFELGVVFIELETNKSNFHGNISIKQISSSN